jgi:hypothetical protein
MNPFKIGLLLSMLGAPRKKLAVGELFVSIFHLRNAHVAIFAHKWGTLEHVRTSFLRPREVKPSAAPGDGLYEGMDWLTTRKVEPLRSR